MKKFKNLITLAVASALLLGSCGTTPESNTSNDTQNEQNILQADEPKIVRLNNIGDPGTLQPGLSQATHESWLLDHMFKGLYTKTPSGVPALSAAESVTTSEDGLVWTFTLKDALWSSGNKVVANDFVEAILFNLDPESASKYTTNLYIIENGEKYNSGEVERDLVGVKAVDDKTFELTLTTPIPYLPDLLTNTFFYPIDSVNAKEHELWYMSEENYSSNGPFTLTKWEAKEEIVLSRNENYFDNDKTNLDELRFSIITDKTTEWQLYQQDELDLIHSALPDVVESLRNENSPELTINPDLSTQFYVFNTEVVPFNNIKVRNALSMAISREDIVNSVTKGGQKPAYTLTPPGVKDEKGNDFSDTLGQLFTEDYDKARALLEEGLKEEGLDINSFVFTIVYNTDDTQKKIAEAIQNMWSVNLGVNCKLENVEFQVMLDKKTTGDFDVIRAGWIGDYVDPMTYEALFVTDAPTNDASWTNKTYDDYVNKALYNTNPSERMEDMRLAEKILIEEMPIMPIMYQSKIVVQKPYLEDVYTPINKLPNLEFAKIVK